MERRFTRVRNNDTKVTLEVDPDSIITLGRLGFCWTPDNRLLTLFKSHDGKVAYIEVYDESALDGLVKHIEIVRKELYRGRPADDDADEVTYKQEVP